MEHYTLNGYQLNHSTLSPSVKLYGIFDTLSDALNFLSSYMTQRCEQNDGGNRYLNGNGYRLWIKKICLLFTSQSPRDLSTCRMPSSG